MAPTGRDFKRPFSRGLTAHIGEVGEVGEVVQVPELDGVSRVCLGPGRARRGFAAQHLSRFGE